MYGAIVCSNLILRDSFLSISFPILCMVQHFCVFESGRGGRSLLGGSLKTKISGPFTNVCLYLCIFVLSGGDC